MNSQKRVNPNYEGDSRLILKLFGDGIENGALLHRQLVRRAYNRLRNIEDAEDTVQDFYLDFSRRAGQEGYLTFELTKDLDINNQERFRRLAQGSFSRYLVDKYRRVSKIKKKVKLESQIGNKDGESAFLKLMVASEDYPETYAIRNEEDEILKDKVERLPEGKKEIITLHYDLGLKLREIAEKLDIPIGTVKSRLSESLESLRRMRRAG